MLTLCEQFRKTHLHQKNIYAVSYHVFTCLSAIYISTHALLCDLQVVWCLKHLKIFWYVSWYVHCKICLISILLHRVVFLNLTTYQNLFTAISLLVKCLLYDLFLKGKKKKGLLWQTNYEKCLFCSVFYPLKIWNRMTYIYDLSGAIDERFRDN